MFGLEYKHSGTYGKPSNSQARILSHWKDWLPERVVTAEPDRDLRAAKKRDLIMREEVETTRKAKETERRTSLESAQRYTVAALADTYVQHLRRLGKTSARDVESIFRNHLHGTE